jgi:acyl-CoA dehydrogenase
MGDMENPPLATRHLDDIDPDVAGVLSSAEVTGTQVRELVARWLEANREEVDAAYVIADTPSVAESLKAELPWLRLLYAHGWTRWGWPEGVGGFGGGPRLRAMIYDAFWSLGYQVPDRMNILEVLGPPLIEYQPEAAAVEVPQFLRGEQMWAQCFSEPSAGSDMAAIRTTARRDGDRFIVNGQKIWNSYGHVGDRAILLARTGTPESRHRGLSMFWFDMDTPGVEARGIRQASGRDEFAEVFFDGAVLPASALMGELDGGWAVAMYLMQYERGMFSWWRQTIMNHRLDAVTAELARRDRLESDAATALARTYRILSVLRSRSAATIEQLQSGELIGPQSSIDKVLLSRAERSLADLEHSVFYPAMEYSADAEAQHRREEWFHSRAVSVYGGATEIQYDIIADRILGMPKEPRNGR